MNRASMPDARASAMRSSHCCADCSVEAGPQSQGTSRPMRPGCFSASATAVMPPMESPTKCARSILSASNSATTSAARRSKLYGPSGAFVPPWPRWS